MVQNNDMNDMDEIERELKRIQVLRERLALEKELERHAWKRNTIGAAKDGIEGIGRFIGRWWKWAALGTVSLGAVFGAFVWIASIEQANNDAAEAQYRTEQMEYVRSRCRTERCDGNVNIYDIGCSNELFHFRECESKAQSDFYKAKQGVNASALSTPPKS